MSDEVAMKKNDVWEEDKGKVDGELTFINDCAHGSNDMKSPGSANCSWASDLQHLT
jgi:hypothetical protein